MLLNYRVLDAVPCSGKSGMIAQKENLGIVSSTLLKISIVFGYKCKLLLQTSNKAECFTYYGQICYKI